MRTVTPSKNLIPALRLWACAILIVIAFVDGIIMVFSVTWALLLALIAAILFLAVWLFYIPSFAKNMLINISESSISVSRGVIFKKKYVIPNSRQVYASRIKTPVDLIFDTTNITINLVRGKVTVMGLTKADADFIMSYVGEVSKNR